MGIGDKMMKNALLLILILVCAIACSYLSPSDTRSSEFTYLQLSQLSPSYGSSVTDTTPNFSWEALEEADFYQLQISQTHAALDTADSIICNATSYTISQPLDNNIAYYWRVRGVNQQNEVTMWSPAFYFQIDWGTITELSPVDNARITNTTPEFSWDTVDGVDYYEIQIAGSKAGIEQAVTDKCYTNSYTPITSLTEDVSHFWRVRAIDADDQKGQWSETINVAIVGPVVPMIAIAGGRFTMGRTSGRGESNELPLHEVTLSDFSMAETEVTWSQWDKIYSWAIINGYKFENIGRAGSHGLGDAQTFNEPVTSIDWSDALVWCNAASEYQGLDPVYSYNHSVIKDSTGFNGVELRSVECDWTANGYRLPTEAEWEYAAKGGQNDTDNGEYAGSDYVGVGWYENGHTRPVGTKPANELGLYDMSGNVWEYCWDFYAKYNANSMINPTGPDPNSTTTYYYRVKRGGSCDWDVNYHWSGGDCRVSCRGTITANPKNTQSNYIGFRPVLR